MQLKIEKNLAKRMKNVVRLKKRKYMTGPSGGTRINFVISIPLTLNLMLITSSQQKVTLDL